MASEASLADGGGGFGEGCATAGGSDTVGDAAAGSETDVLGVIGETGASDDCDWERVTAVCE